MTKIAARGWVLRLCAEGYEDIGCPWIGDQFTSEDEALNEAFAYAVEDACLWAQVERAPAFNYVVDQTGIIQYGLAQILGVK